MEVYIYVWTSGKTLMSFVPATVCYLMYGDPNRILIFLHFGAFDGESKSTGGWRGWWVAFSPREFGGLYVLAIFLFPGATAPSGLGPSRCRGFTTRVRHATLGRTPVTECSARHRHHYLTTNNTHKRQTSMCPAKFEPAVSRSKRS